MSKLLIGVLNLSISASFVALVVILIRLLLKKAPKVYSYALWAVVFFRFVCPFTLQLPVSPVPLQQQTIPQDIVYSESPSIQSGLTAFDTSVNNVIESALPPVNPAASVNPIQTVLGIGEVVWLTGLFSLLIYGVISYLRLKKRVATAIRASENIYETNLIQTPFVLGFIKPKIYVPINLEEKELEYVTAHEKTHLRRFDHLIKPAAFLIVCVHWFNPAAWVSYLLMAKDMELSADESVMKNYSFDIRGNYASSLLALSVKKSGLISPLAFGETGVKTRVKNVLNYKKPAFWVSAVAIVAVIAISLSLGVSKKNAPPKQPDELAPTGVSESGYKTNYTKATISFNSSNTGFKSLSSIDITDYNAVARIDNAIAQSVKHSDETDLKNNYTYQYTIKLSNSTGGYSAGLYYDTLYDKAYLGKDGSLFETGTDFARYIDSLFENPITTYKIDKADAELFKSYGWTLDYLISEKKIRLNDIGALSDFDPNSYYFAYNNELSKDIGLDMSGYSNTDDIEVSIYRVYESMPKEFYPIKSNRGIVVKHDSKTIGAYLSAGRHSAYLACSLKGKNFEAATGQTLDKWLEGKVKADSAEARLSKLEPEQVIEEYFNALSKRDEKSAVYCLSKMRMIGSLTVNMQNTELYNVRAGLPLAGDDSANKSAFGSLISAKLIKVEPLKGSDSEGMFRVTVNLLYSDGAITSNGSGQQSWDCSMIYESPETGWKIVGFGHG